MGVALDGRGRHRRALSEHLAARHQRVEVITQSRVEIRGLEESNALDLLADLCDDGRIVLHGSHDWGWVRNKVKV